MFVGLHVLLAERTETPELAISMEEGKEFMAAVQNVMRHYSVETTQKTLDIVALMGTASGIYVPRLAGITARRNAAKRGQRPRNPAPQSQPQAEAPGNIVSIVPDMSGSAGFTGES